MPNLVVCPACKKGLRSAASFTPGQKIRCPACQTTFVATDSHATASSVQAKMASPVVAKGLPASPPPARQAKAPALVDDFDDELEPVHPQHGRQQNEAYPPIQRRRSHLGLILGLASGLAVLVVLGVTGFVWPGFLLPGRPPSNARSLLAYVPSDSTIIAGAQIGLFRKEAKFKAKWDEIRNQVAALPPDAHELLDSADEVLVAAGSDLTGSVVFVASTDVPYDPEKVKRLTRAGPAVQVEGQALYPLQEPIAGKQAFLALPTDKIIVLGILPEGQLGKVLKEAQTAKLHPDLQEQVEQAHRGLVWLAARFDDSAKQKIGQLQGQIGLFTLVLGQDLPNLVNAAQRQAKGALANVDLGDQNLKLTVGITCKDGDDATLAKIAVRGMWDKAGMWMPNGGQFGAILGEIRQSFAINVQGTTVLASVEVNQDTLLAMADAMPNLGNPGGNPFQMKAGK